MVQTRIQEMKQKLFNLQIFEFLVNVLLLVTTYIFTTEMIYEYLEGNTNFSVTEKPIDVEDIPTLTICLESKRIHGSKTEIMKYGKDFTIEAMNSTAYAWDPEDSAMVTLVEGLNEIALAGQRRQILLQQLVVYQNLPHVLRNCVRMVSRMEQSQLHFINYLEGSGLAIGAFTVTTSQNVFENIESTNLYVTSERNSYGATIGQWFDGKVKPFQLMKGALHSIKIPKMNRYEYLKHKCSSASFYQCLGKKLKKHRMCHYDGPSCSLISLPVKETPLCTNHSACVDYEALASAVHDCKNKTPCYTEEYLIEEVKEWSSSDPDQAKKQIMSWWGDAAAEVLENQMNKYIVWIDLMKEMSSNGRYNTAVQKYVHKEFLSWTGTGLVGNVGGQLGLWLGFSFTGFIAGVVNLAPKIMGFCQKIFLRTHHTIGSEALSSS